MAERNTSTNPRQVQTEQDPNQLDERMVHIDRVARVVKGGRRFRFRALVIVGDHKGRVGAGVSKGQDVTTAVSKATDVAKKNMVKISLYKDTIPQSGYCSARNLALSIASVFRAIPLFSPPQQPSSSSFSSPRSQNMR